MLGEITLLAQCSNNARVRQQFVALDSYALPFVEGRNVTFEKTEEIVPESRHLTFSLGASDLDQDRTIWPRNLHPAHVPVGDSANPATRILLECFGYVFPEIADSDTVVASGLKRRQVAVTQHIRMSSQYIRTC